MKSTFFLYPGALCRSFKHAYVIIVIFTLGLLGSCRKFVEIAPPDTQLVSTSVFRNSATATSALLYIYWQTYSNSDPYNIELATGLLSDEFTNYSSGSYLIQYYTNSMQSSNTFGPWNNAYNYIYQANAVIEGLQNNSLVAKPVEDQLTGEAKFIRAFWNFYLVNCYGDIPLATGTNYRVNKSLPRINSSKVYEAIISELKDAQTLLNTDFVDASDTAVTTDRVRPTKWAAAAMLARVYLYTGDYANAETQASAVINNTGMFNLVTDLSQVFLANSNEAIWQLGVPLPNNNSYNTPEGYNFILQGAPSSQAISPQLMNAFEANDQRKTGWIGSYTTSDVPAVTYYYPFKYRVFNDANVTEDVMMLRLAEQYLIRAEARAHGSGAGITDAISDLNIIRRRAGLPDYSGSTDQGSVLQAILHERQVELFTEGHRWFDLVRTNSADTVLGSPGNVCHLKGGTWNPDWQLFPIPQSERNTDPNLTQNPGY